MFKQITLSLAPTIENCKLREKTISQADRGNFAENSSDWSDSELLDLDEEDIPAPAEEVGPPIPLPAEEVGPPIPPPAEEAGLALPLPAEEVGPALPLPAEEGGPALPLPVAEGGPALPLPVEEVGPAVPLLDLDHLDGIRTPEQVVRIPASYANAPAPPADNFGKVAEEVENIEVIQAQVYLSQFKILQSDVGTGDPMVKISDQNKMGNESLNFQMMTTTTVLTSNTKPSSTLSIDAVVSFVIFVFLEIIYRWLLDLWVKKQSHKK
jgi:hypothetical protein